MRNLFALQLKKQRSKISKKRFQLPQEDIMYARVSTIMGKPENIDRVVDYLNKAAFPGNEEGWKGAYALVNRQTGKMLTITLWETREAMEATVPDANQIRGEAASMAGAGQPVVEVYEVALKP